MMIKVTFAHIFEKGQFAGEVLVAEIVAQSIHAAWDRLCADDPCWRTILCMAHDITSEAETPLGKLGDCIKSYTGEEFQKQYPQWAHNLQMAKMK